MSLIDIAGLALAALQVTVALVGAYRGKVKDGNLRELDHLLKTRTTIFLNSLRDLLAPVSVAILEATHFLALGI